MVEVTVRYFANLRDALGTSSETYQLATASLVALRAEQQARHGAAADELGTNGVKVALNQTLLDGALADAPALANGDEIAFLPPVTGG